MQAYAFLSGGGMMADLIRAYPWHETPLGTIETWPPHVRHTAAMMLRSDVPMVALFGIEGTMLYNDAYSVFAGARHPRLLGSPVRTGWPEVAAFNDNVMKVGLAGKTLSYKDQELTLYRTGKAEQVWMNLDYSPILDDSGHPSAVLAIVVETTAKVRAERHIESERQRLRQMFEQAPGFICTLQGPDHVYDFVNEAHTQLFQRNDIVGKSVREAFPELEGQGFFELLDHVFQTGQRYAARGVPIWVKRSAAGPEQLLHIDFIYAPMFDDRGTVCGIFCEGQDVTETVAAQTALKEADRRKDEFLATLAHELRNPLAPLCSAIELLKTGGGRLNHTDLYRMMDRQLTHLVRLVDDLLEISRITRGTFELQQQHVDLGEVVRNALETSRPLLIEQSHSISVHGPAEPVWTTGDPVRLSQIFSNLLNNAARYSGRGKPITVEITTQGKEATVQIIDRGEGFTAEQATRLFKMFARGESSVGLGVGLALSQRLAEMHGGSVHGASEGPGLGSVFTVRLPLAEVVIPHEPAKAFVADLAMLRVLVVDDNVDAALTLCELLRCLGAHVETASDGRQALDAVEAFRPNVVLLDIGMPEMNGYEVSLALRQRYRSDQLMIIGLSGWSQDEDRAQGRAAGFDHHLNKPADFNQLQQVLLSIVHRNGVPVP